jgi:hypothetical protein
VSTANAQLGSEGCAPASRSKIDDITKEVITFDDVTSMKGYVAVTSGAELDADLDDEKVRNKSVA